MRHVLCLFWSVIVFCSCNQQKTNKQEAANSNSNSQNAAICAPEVIDKSWYSSGNTAPLFSQLEGIHFPVSTKNAKVQQYFDQGLMLSFGFNHAEAARSFYEAARQDSTCAMCWWGISLAHGPNINMPMMPDAVAPAVEALANAQKLGAGASATERDYIAALAKRYSVSLVRVL